MPQDLASPTEQLRALLDKTDVAYFDLPNGEGFRIHLHSKHDIDPVLIAGEDTFWTLVSLGGNWSAVPRNNILDEINEINSELPFGVVYYKNSLVTFRNTIRSIRLTGENGPKDLVLWLLVTAKIVEDTYDRLKNFIS